MISLKKYEELEIDVVLIKNDIIITSGTDIGGGSGSGGEDPWGTMSFEKRPLGLYKRN